MEAKRSLGPIVRTHRQLACFSVLHSVFENKTNKQETDKGRLHLLVGVQTVTVC